MYCNVCNQYRKLKKPLKYHMLKKPLSLSFVSSKCGHQYEKIFKEEESFEILKSIINNIEEYQKIYHNVWRKHKLRICTERYKWNKKLFNWRNKSKWINE